MVTHPEKREHDGKMATILEKMIHHPLVSSISFSFRHKGHSPIGVPMCYCGAFVF